MYKFSSDIYMKKGYSHYMCEDYIYKKADYITLSDGCSSSPNTDIGARLLCRSFIGDYIYKEKMYINDLYNKYKFLLDNDPAHCNELDATLLYIDADGMMCVHGDGFTFYKEKDKNEVVLYEIKYKSGAPFYLSYHLDEERKQSYKNQFSMEVDIIKSKIDLEDSSKVTVEEEYTVNPDGLLTNDDLIGGMGTIEYMGCASDGLGSFLKNKTIPIGITDVLWDICQFKTFNGEFLKRRLNKVMKDYAKRDIDHYDDFSIGMLYFGEEKGNGEN